MTNQILTFCSNSIKCKKDTILVAPTNTVVSAIRNSLLPSVKLKQKQLISDAIPLFEAPNFLLIGPAAGSSSIRLALEPLLHAGASSVMLLGYAGALPNSELSSGDIVSAEGLFHCKRLDEQAASEQFGNKQLLLKESYPSAFIASIENPYEESLELVKNISNYASLIEMEAFEAHSLCLDYSAEFAAAFVVSDIWGETWTSSLGSKLAKNSIQILANKFVSLASQRS